MSAIAKHLEDVGGSVMLFESDTGWQALKSTQNNGQISWVTNSESIKKGKSLVLLADWITNPADTSRLYNAGFAEAAADKLFASLVQLDQQNQGTVGQGQQLYDAQGRLIRTQGAMALLRK